MRLTIEEYCKSFKMSKEMLNSKLRAKKLDYIIEDNTTYIIVSDRPIENDNILQIPRTKAIAKPKTTVATILNLYQRENQQLKEKIIQLEEKIDKLIDDKEQMLRDEMQKIEQVYSAKDEQLKTILELVNTKLMMDNNHPQIHDTQAVESEKEIEKIEEAKLIELKIYLKSLNMQSYQRKIIKARFLAVHNSDVRIILQNGKIYLDFSKYDYSDLLEY